MPIIWGLPRRVVQTRSFSIRNSRTAYPSLVKLFEMAPRDGIAPPYPGSEPSVITSIRTRREYANSTLVLIRRVNEMVPALGAAPRPVASKAIVQMLLHYTGVVSVPGLHRVSAISLISEGRQRYSDEMVLDTGIAPVAFCVSCRRS